MLGNEGILQSTWFIAISSPAKMKSEEEEDEIFDQDKLLKESMKQILKD